jgi:hypothetical protein
MSGGKMKKTGGKSKLLRSENFCIPHEKQIFLNAWFAKWTKIIDFGWPKDFFYKHLNFKLSLLSQKHYK